MSQMTCSISQALHARTWHVCTWQATSTNYIKHQRRTARIHRVVCISTRRIEMYPECIDQQSLHVVCKLAKLHRQNGKKQHPRSARINCVMSALTEQDRYWATRIGKAISTNCTIDQPRTARISHGMCALTGRDRSWPAYIGHETSFNCRQHQPKS